MSLTFRESVQIGSLATSLTCFLYVRHIYVNAFQHFHDLTRPRSFSSSSLPTSEAKNAFVDFVLALQAAQDADAGYQRDQRLKKK